MRPSTPLMTLVLLLVLAPMAHGEDTPTFKPAPHYAELFEEGRTWRFSVRETVSYHDPSVPQADKDGMVRAEQKQEVACRVEGVVQAHGGVASAVTCDGYKGPVGNGVPVAGSYYADKEGLWILAGTPDSLEALKAEHGGEPWLSAKPKASKQKGPVDPEVGGSCDKTVSKQGNAWCVEDACTGPDDNVRTLCFEKGKGFAGAKMHWAGGSVFDMTVTPM